LASANAACDEGDNGGDADDDDDAVVVVFSVFIGDGDGDAAVVFFVGEVIGEVFLDAAEPLSCVSACVAATRS
jgi:hypothetical protein